MIELRRTPWQQFAIAAFKGEFNDDKKFADEEKAVLAHFASPFDVYNELAHRIINLSEPESNDPLSAFRLAEESYRQDVRDYDPINLDENHQSLLALGYTYEQLKKAEE